MNKNPFLCVFLVCSFFMLVLTSCGGGGGSGKTFIKNPDGGDDGDDTVAKEGTVTWSYKVEGSIGSTAARAADGTLYITSADGAVYAVGMDGGFKWKFRTGDAIVASPAVAEDGTIYVGSMDRQLYAIRPDGTLKWVLPTKENFTSSPAVASDGTIYAAGKHQDISCFCNGEVCVQLSYLHAVTPEGILKWSFRMSGEVNSSPAIAQDGTVYIGTDGVIQYDRVNICDDESDYLPSNVLPDYFPANGHLYAINPNGSLKWDFKTLGDVDSSPAIGTDGTIYFGSDRYIEVYGEAKNKIVTFSPTTEGYLYALTPDGFLKWYLDLYGDVDSSPAVASDGTIYAGSDKNDVFAIDPAGFIKWVFPTRGDVNAGPVLGSDGTIFIGSNDNSLYALNPDGTKKWEFETSSPIDSSASLGPDKNLYFGGTDGTFYSLGTNGTLMDSPWPKFRQNLKNTGRK